MLHETCRHVIAYLWLLCCVKLADFTVLPSPADFWGDAQ